MNCRTATTKRLKLRTTALLMALLGPSVLASASEVSTRSFAGYAHDLETGDLLYTEIHHEFADDEGEVALSTVYYGPGGQTIAVREVDFAEHPLAPPYRFEDTRAGYREGLQRNDGEIVVYRQLPKQSHREEKKLREPDLLVADASFDRLVITHWDRLLAGIDVRADFLVSSRLRSMRFVIAKEREWTLDGEPVATFRMTSTNPLVRLLMGHVRVTYHQHERYLMRYEGVSNLKAANSGIMKVQINFPTAERGDWQAVGRSSSKVVRYVAR